MHAIASTTDAAALLDRVTPQHPTTGAKGGRVCGDDILSIFVEREMGFDDLSRIWRTQFGEECSCARD